MNAMSSTRGQSSPATTTQDAAHQAEPDAAEPQHEHRTDIAPSRVTRAVAKRTREFAPTGPADTPAGEQHPADTIVAGSVRPNADASKRQARDKPTAHGDTREAAAAAAELRATRASKRAAAREARTAPPGQQMRTPRAHTTHIATMSPSHKQAHEQSLKQPTSTAPSNGYTSPPPLPYSRATYKRARA